MPAERGTRDGDGQRLYVLLALFDYRDGSSLGHLVRSAREGWECSHPDMAEEDAWAEFDTRWGQYTSGERLDMARTYGGPKVPHAQ